MSAAILAALKLLTMGISGQSSKSIGNFLIAVWNPMKSVIDDHRLVGLGRHPKEPTCFMVAQRYQEVFLERSNILNLHLQLAKVLILTQAFVGICPMDGDSQLLALENVCCNAQSWQS
jgi:hypothetical protein